MSHCFDFDTPLNTYKKFIECLKEKNIKGLKEITIDELEYKDVSGQYMSRDQLLSSIEKGHLIYFEPLRESTDQVGWHSLAHTVLIRPYSNETTEMKIKTTYYFTQRDGKLLIKQIEREELPYS